MPTISSKKNLGSLFGGRIASINYNFQTASQPSTATITVVSENNTFSIPNFNEQVSIPPFGLPMIVVERGRKKDEAYTTFQVELVESISQVLDRELVLVYGEHTDPQYQLNNDLYFVNNSIFVPKQYYPAGTVFNPSIKFPNLEDIYVKSHGNGVNVIGTARATYVEQGSENLTGSKDLKGEPYWVTMQGGEIKESISSYVGEFLYSPEIAGSIVVNYGYTLKNLKQLILSKGVSFDSKTDSIMDDENLFFSDSGTIREVLTSCLSKIGRSFYVDPFSQKIVLISNADVARINNNLRERFSSFTNVAGATQISLKESIYDVEAVHLVVKGNLDYVDNNPSPPEKDTRARKQIFYKLVPNLITDILTDAEISLMKRVAPLTFTISNEQMIDRYLFALGFQYPTENWGNLYGKNEYIAGTFEPVKKATDSTTPIANWQRLAVDEGVATRGSFGNYNPAFTVGARQLYRDNPKAGEKGEPQQLPALSGSEVDYYQTLKDFIQMWTGVYFSAPMSESQIEKREYISAGIWKGDFQNEFDFVKVKGSDLVSETEELQFITNILKRLKIDKDYTIEELARRALGSAFNNPDGGEGVIGSGKYFVIALRKLFKGTKLQYDDIYNSISTNFFHFKIPSNDELYMVYTKLAQDSVLKIEEACVEAFENEMKKARKKMVIQYIKKKPDQDPDEDNDREEIHDRANLLSIKNLNSNVQNFYKRSLNSIVNRYSEVKLFLANILELNPEFSGPLLSTTIEYFRHPLKSDFDIENGVDSVSISISNEGVSTTVSYSSKKFAQVDLSVVRDLLGGNATGFFKRLNLPAFRKNSQRL